jgi:Dimerisation domain
VTAEPSPKLSFHPLLRLLADFGNSRILDAAPEYDFFTLIARGFHSHEEIAHAAGTAPRSTRIVLDSLIALSLVEKRQGRGDKVVDFYLPFFSSVLI